MTNQDNITDGVFNDLSIEAYHQNKSHYSSTGLKHAKRSLKEFKSFIDGDFDTDEKKSHFDFGNAFEIALVEPDNFEDKVAVFKESELIAEIMEEKPETKTVRLTKPYKDGKKEFFDDNADKYIINDTGEESMETIQKMVESCYQDKVIQSLVKNLDYQISAFWKDKTSGLNLKTRPDVCHQEKKVIVDIKSTIDGSPKAFSRQLANLDYPFQACLQIKGCIESGMIDSLSNYYWLVVEKKIPFSATLYEFTPDDIQTCMFELDYILGNVSKAIKENFFPAYSQESDNKLGILDAELPLWYRSQ